MDAEFVSPIPLDVLGQAVLPLLAFDSNADLQAIGSAFVVAIINPKTAILFTARHNLDFIKELRPTGVRAHSTALAEFRAPPNWKNVSAAGAFLLLASEKGNCLARMQQWWLLEGLDVAMISAVIDEESPAFFEWKLEVDSSPIVDFDASSDQPLMLAAGYPSTSVVLENLDVEDGYEAQVDFSLMVRPCGGTEVLHGGTGIHRWPGFLVSCALDSGMSGGPIISMADKIPRVRGVIGGDFSMSAADGRVGSGVRAFASMIWPAMAIPAQMQVSLGSGETLVSGHVVDLARAGFITDVGRSFEHLEITEVENDLKISWVG